jgi:arabinan endo-1,5-alpha-L-arabinosidase
VLLAACAGTAAPAAPAPAKLSGDFRAHDPSMIKQGGVYYLFSTGDEYGLNGGTIQIRRSGDMARWELAGTVFDQIPDWVAQALGGAPPNLWAPDIVERGGRYYLYYAGSRFGSNRSVIGLATNATLDRGSPDYRWNDAGLVLESTAADNWNAIDPSLALDAEGQPWLAFGSFWDGVKMRRIDPRTGKLDAADPTLYSLASRGGGPIEAPAIVYRAGFFYLFVSFDLCCRGADSTYKIMVGRAGSITGPYADRAGVLMSQGGGTLVLQGKDRARGPGGQSVYLDGGTYRLVHHYYDAFDLGIPKLAIDDLAWDADGWPSVVTR